MDSRSLVLDTLAGKNTAGRVPRDLWTLPWAQARYPQALAALRSEFVWDIATAPVVLPGQNGLERGDIYARGDYVDPWGCRFTNIQPGVIGEVKRPLVAWDDDWTDTSRVHIPEEWLHFDMQAVDAFCQGTDAFVLSGHCPRPFEQLQFIRMTEQLYADIALGSKGLRAFMARMHDFYCRLLTRWAQTRVDALFIMDDWGSQQSLLINPRAWRELFLPMYRDYAHIAHRHGKKLFMHSDGYTLEIIPDLIDMGLDAFNTQIFCMGVDKLAPFAGQLTFWGEMCRQNLLVHATPDEIDAAVRAVHRALWRDGGCIAQCEFGAGARPENVLQVYKSWSELAG